MNNGLLSDKKYVEMIKETIKRVTYQYTENNSTVNDVIDTPESLQHLPLKINPELFLDTLMMEIRRDTILYSAQQKRERNFNEQKLNHDIEILEKEMQKEAADENTKFEYERKKKELEEIIKYQAEGAFVRSRAQHKIHGEKPTKLFCSLETFNAVQKYVSQLLVKNEAGE